MGFVNFFSEIFVCFLLGGIFTMVVMVIFFEFGRETVLDVRVGCVGAG